MQNPCWTLNHATDGVGQAFPQHQVMSDGYDYSASNSVHRLPLNAVPEFTPNFDTVIIHGHARLVDLFSSSAIHNTGYLVSERFRLVLEQFTMPLHCFYSVPMLHHNKPVHAYYWLQLPEPRLALTDALSIGEIEAAIAAEPEIAAVDLLRLYRPQRYAYCFVSNRLRNAIESAGITGVRFGTSKLFKTR
jgi:hypothetical protein